MELSQDEHNQVVEPNEREKKSCWQMQPAKEIDVWLVFRCSSSNYTRLQDGQKFSDLDSNSLSLCVGGGNWIFRVYRRDQMTKVQRQSSIYRTWNCYYLFIHARREMKDELILLQELSCRFPDSNMYFIIGRVMRQKAAIARQAATSMCWEPQYLLQSDISSSRTSGHKN